MPRLPIASVMLVIAIAAVDFAAVRAVSDVQNKSRASLGRGSKDPAEFDRVVNRRTRADLLASGALPTGNVLAVGLFRYRRRRIHPFLLGFEAFGATALALYIAVASCVTYEGLRPYLDVVLDPLRKSVGPSPSLIYATVVYLTFAVILVLPQVAFALIGGLLFRRFGTAGR